MKHIYFFGLIFIMACSSPQKKPKTESLTQNFYVGTYTDGDSRGIYKYELSEDGKMKNIGLMAESTNPSFLVKSFDGKYLVAVNEISDENSKGTVESYSILEDTLVLISRKSSGGAHPCHISINEENDILVSNYTGGNVELLKLDEQGELINLDLVQHTGKGTTTRQEAPHAHSSWFAPNGHIISADLGTNELWFSKIDDESQKLIPLELQHLAMEEGSGPRHLCFHPNSKWIYVINELNGTITQVEISAEGTYQTLSSSSTLSADFTGENYSADIHISSDGRFVYASNRGPNEIAIFQVDSTNGKLSLTTHEDTRGNWPRNFAFSPDEKFILVAHQYSNNITCFKRDQNTGLLNFFSEIEAPSPVCILF